MINPEQISVLCDENADRNQLLKICSISPLLAQIPQHQIQILPSGTALKNQPEIIRNLALNDRPDYIFMYNSSPYLVVELTEHGYTADNGLQRFTRAAASIESGVPFLYFTPFSRVRDDEMDISGKTAVARNVTTDLFKGLSRLSEIHQIPTFAINWPVAKNGKPQKLGFTPSIRDIQHIFGELVNYIETISTELAPLVSTNKTLMLTPIGLLGARNLQSY